uniref:Putative S25 ribosomal protein n=1 Tax=viral metagenome TaxID=1070528 RepID=A0A6M3XHL4_9ZZZZ
MKVSKWNNCYDLQWGKMLTPESFSHPAKVSPGLAKRIFEHCLEKGYIEKGGKIIVTQEILNKIKKEVDTHQYLQV